MSERLTNSAGTVPAGREVDAMKRQNHALEKGLPTSVSVHLTSAELAQHHDGTWGDDLTRTRVTAHLRCCLICQRRLQFLQEVTAEAAAIAPADVPPIYYEIAQRILHPGPPVAAAAGEQNDETSGAAADELQKRSRVVPTRGSGPTQELPSSEEQGTQTDARLWVGNTSYPLRPTATDPTLCEVAGLSFATLVMARQRDRRNPSSCVARIEGIGKTLVIPLAKFDNVQQGQEASLGLAATHATPVEQVRPLPPRVPVRKLHCRLAGRVVEVFSSAAEEGAVFLRLSQAKEE